MKGSGKEERTKTTDPYLDGGWGWIVLLASFFSQVLIGSVYFGYGVLLPEWLEEFQLSSAITSVVGSTAAGVISGSGPIASFFILKWGCRTAHMIGGFVIATALILCTLSTSMVQIFIFYSVIAGLGGGLCFVPSVITLSEYFKAKRSIAIGIVAGGFGLGSFIFPVVFEYLIQEYGWRGAMLIAGGVNFNMIAFGLVMCPVKKAPSMLSLSSCICSKSEDEIIDESRNILKSEISTDKSKPLRRTNSFQLMRAWLRNPLVRRKSSISNMAVAAENSPIDDDVFEIVEVAIPDSIPEEDESIEKSGLLSAPEKNTYLSQFFKVLRRGDFYVMLFYNITMFIGMMIVFGLTPLRAVTDDYLTTQQGAVLVSIIGFSSSFGRFVWGFAAAFKSVNTPVLFITLRLFAGFLTLLSLLSSSFTINAIYCASVGLMLGNWSIYPVVVAELFGDQLLTVAFGYLEAANGIGCIIGPFVGGYLADIFHHYQYSFIAGGCSLLLGAVPLIVTVFLRRIRVSRKRTRLHENESIEYNL